MKRILKSIQAWLRKRSVKYGANTTVMIVVVIGIIVLVQAISLRHNRQFDLTSDKRYTLAEQTISLLEALEQDVTITAFFTSGHGGRDVLENLLQQYARISDRVKYEFVDPVKRPGRAEAYGITSDGTIVLETAAKQQKIFESDEEALTNGLIKVTREAVKTVYLISGHGESAIDDESENGMSGLARALRDQGYEVQDLLLLQAEAIPEDAAAVVLAGPQKELLPTERDALNAYLSREGRLLGMFDPGYAVDTATMLEAYGVTADNTTVIDANPLGQLMGAGPTMPIASEFGRHPITDGLTSAVIFPLAQPLSVADTLPDGVRVETLALSSESSWAETSREELESGTVEPTEGRDPPGPLPLAVVITAETSASDRQEAGGGETPAEPQPETGTPLLETRIVAFGDSDFARNAYIGWAGNGDLALNAINWLAEEDDLVAVRAKDPQLAPLMLTTAQAQMLFMLAVALMPMTAIITGIMVYMNRKNATR